MTEENAFTTDRLRMVTEQIIRRGIRDPKVLDAMRAVPRHCFVPTEYRHLAYSDGPLPIGNGQTISQPYIVALMTQMLHLKGDEVVLEVGTGSGYQAAILAHIVRQVYTIEQYVDLAEKAEELLLSLEITNVHVHVGDGTLGLPEFSPFDAILVTAAAPEVPQPLLDQLADGGRMVIPVGGHFSQFLQYWERQGDDFRQDIRVPVAFVPLRGRHGWNDKSGGIF